MVPVGDFLGQAILDGRPGLVDPVQPPVPNFLDVLGHDMSNGVVLRLLFERPGDPGAFGPGQQVGHRGLLGGERPIVEVGGVVQVPGLAGGVHLHIEQPPRDAAALPRWQEAGILDGMFEGDEHPGLQAGVAGIDQNRATFQ